MHILQISCHISIVHDMHIAEMMLMYSGRTSSGCGGDDEQSDANGYGRYGGCRVARPFCVLCAAEPHSDVNSVKYSHNKPL